jgi:O-antigen/teichoic acid export membrane protein
MYFVESLRGQLLKGVIGTGTLKIANMGLALVSSVLLARLMGAEGYGVYGFAMAVVSLLAIPIQLGLPQFIVRQSALYVQQSDYAGMRGLLIRTNQIVLVISVLLANSVSYIWEKHA